MQLSTAKESTIPCIVPIHGNTWKHNRKLSYEITHETYVHVGISKIPEKMWGILPTPTYVSCEIS